MLDVTRVEQAKDTEFAARQEQDHVQGDENGNILIEDERFNIMGADYFMADTLHELHDIYGDGAGGILRNTGERYGKNLLTFVQDPDPQTQFGRFLGLLAFMGYSDPEVHEDHIIFPSSPTAVEYAKNDYEPLTACYVLSGMLSAAAESITDHQFVEEKCIANGDDHCCFTLHPSSSI